jgi:hypothetical protein
MLWIFPAGKIRRLQSGANSRSWVPEAGMLTPRPPKPLVLIVTNLGNRWVRRYQVSDHGRQIRTPEGTLRLPVVEQHARIEGCIDVQILELS